jgi:hypothetical protein
MPSPTTAPVMRDGSGTACELRRHGLDMQTPLLTLSRALRCTHCGEREGKPGSSRRATIATVVGP